MPIGKSNCLISKCHKYSVQPKACRTRHVCVVHQNRTQFVLIKLALTCLSASTSFTDRNCATASRMSSGRSDMSSGMCDSYASLYAPEQRDGDSVISWWWFERKEGKGDLALYKPPRPSLIGVRALALRLKGSIAPHRPDKHQQLRAVCFRP